jgi:hypothetical protein
MKPKGPILQLLFISCGNTNIVPEPIKRLPRACTKLRFYIYQALHTLRIEHQSTLLRRRKGTQDLQNVGLHTTQFVHNLMYRIGRQ